MQYGGIAYPDEQYTHRDTVRGYEVWMTEEQHKLTGGIEQFFGSDL